jgi:hypothetical protein
MGEFEINDLIQPCLDKNISDRIYTFRNAFFKYGENHGLSTEKLITQFYLGIGYDRGEPTAAFGFNDNSSLDYKFKENIFVLFNKHFPNGIRTSLIGYPKSLMYPPL